VSYSFDYLRSTLLNQSPNKMARIQDYVVITSSKGFENLESLIKENIRLGWQPLGGVAVVNPGPDSDLSVLKPIMFAQAMVLYDN
jgi:hypothetical protein